MMLDLTPWFPVVPKCYDARPDPVVLLLAAAQALVTQLQANPGINQEELFMPIYVMPDVPPQYVPVMVAQASVGGQGAEKFDRVIGICHLAQNPAVPPSSAVNVIEPLMEVEDYLTKFEHIKIEGSISFHILQQPVHGLLRDGGEGAYSYVPETGYLGKDQATVLVEISGLKIKVKYFFQVLNTLPTDEDQAEYCPTGKWRISQIINTINGTSLGVSVGVTDLSNGAIGQTTGTSITLDTNAAGYNWFIDNTPADNSEYLPTSNPNEWVAKAGSAAAGKMDMLSVLLHEYGHALGIDHSSNPNDFMATTLTAGVRRMPTADEMALMQQLIAQAKTSVMAAQTGSNAATDQPNNTPLPIIPLGGFGIAFAGLLQRNRQMPC
jgi:hypothetical protein